MEITIDFAHPWSDIHKVARIQREDLNGKQARKVLHVARALLSSNRYASLYVDYSYWCKCYEANLDTWTKYCKERARLEELCRRYEPRTYTVKELDDLTRDEWNEIAPWEFDLLSDFERARYGV